MKQSRFILIVFFYFFSSMTFAQDAITLYNEAKDDFIYGRYEESDRKLDRILQFLGRTNPKIQSLKAQIAFKINDYQAAKIEIEKYFMLVQLKNDASRGHRYMISLRVTIDDALQKQENEYQNTKLKENKKRIEQADKIIEKSKQEEQIKGRFMKMQNGSKFYKLIDQSTDKEALEFYNKYFGETVNDKNTSVYQGYLGEHPIGEYSEEVKKILTSQKEEKAWVKAKNTANTPSYFTYLESYPKGKYAETAKDTIAKWDKQAYENAINVGTQDALRYYLGNFPKGVFRSQVSAKLAERIEYDLYMYAKSNNTFKGYENFIQEYPRGKYSNEVNSILEKGYYNTANQYYSDKDWYKAKNYYDKYIDSYPSGAYSFDVSGSLEKCRHKIKRDKAFGKIGYVKFALTNATGKFGSEPSLSTPLLDPFYGKEGMGGQLGYNFGIGISTSSARPGFHLSFLLGIDASINSVDWSGLGGAWTANSSWTKIMSGDIIAGTGFYYNISDAIAIEAAIAGSLPIVTIYPTLKFEAPNPSYNFIIYPDKDVKSLSDVIDGTYEISFPLTISFGVRRGKIKLSYEMHQHSLKSDYYIKYRSTSKDSDVLPELFSSKFIWETQRIALHYYF